MDDNRGQGGFGSSFRKKKKLHYVVCEKLSCKRKRDRIYI